jgi:hypothetical protein
MMKRKYVGFSKIYAITLKENIIQKRLLKNIYIYRKG